jgi:Tfp pilus assembly protein PilX
VLVVVVVLGLPVVKKTRNEGRRRGRLRGGNFLIELVVVVVLGLLAVRKTRTTTKDDDD